MKYHTSKLIAMLVMVVAVTFAACTDDKPKTEGVATDTTAAATTETTPAASSEPKTFTDIHAVVTGIQPESKMIMLKHEKIGDWMEPMEMPFPVADSAMLGQVKMGDSVLFTVKVTDNQGVITELKK